LPNESHVLENNEKLPEGNGLDDDDDIENIDDDDDLNKLRLLHGNEQLDKPDLRLKDINRLFTELQRAETGSGAYSAGSGSGSNKKNKN
jgi:hypothetical protein